MESSVTTTITLPTLKEINRLARNLNRNERRHLTCPVCKGSADIGITVGHREHYLCRRCIRAQVERMA